MKFLQAQRATLITIILLLLGWAPPAVAAGEVSARAIVEKTEVYIGESFLFQIKIEGDDAPAEPDLSVIKDFTVQPLGGQVNSSSSITIINGKMTSSTKRGYTFSYRLTPRRGGRPVIPPIKVRAGGKIISTQPVMMRTVRPTESSDIKLRFKLSKNKCYVGQPVILTATWYLGKDVRDFHFSLPVLTDNRFSIMDLDEKVDPASYNTYLRVPLEDGEVIAKKSRQTLNGREYMAVTFKKVLIPKVPGEIEVPEGTVTCNVVMGYKGRPSRRPFRSLFDDNFFFGGAREAVVKTVVAPSNTPLLRVMPLPEEGRPAGFNGLVGEYTIDATAKPTVVRVGEPITLTIRVAGPEYMENVVLPPLYQQPALARDFKIPVEMAPGKVVGRVKTFTQTIRAKHAAVKVIPPIELPFFNARTGKYGIARSEPIPIKVSATRIVTAMDAEGKAVPGEASNELETWVAGIAHNYEDPTVLNNQGYGFRMWKNSTALLLLTGLPPLAYVILLASLTIIRRRNANPAAQRARRAYGVLAGELKRIHGMPDPTGADDLLLAALQQYLGAKLGLPAAALTYREVEPALLGRGIDAGTLKLLRGIFEECEAGRYAGGSGTDTAGKDRGRQILALARELERRLK